MESISGTANEFNFVSEVSLLLRHKQGISVAKPDSASLSQCQNISPLRENAMATPDAKFLVAVGSSKIEVLDDKMATIAEFECKDILASALTNSHKFIVAMDFIGKDNYRLIVLSFPKLELLKEFAFKSFSLEKWPILKFAKNDSLAFMAQKTELIVMETPTFGQKKQIPLRDIDNLTLSESSDELLILAATFQKMNGYEKTPSHVSLISNSDFEKPILSQPLERAEDVKAYFSPDGTNLILMTQTYHDETGKSYYGQSNLYFYKKNSQNFKKIPTAEGPIHDIGWSPDSKFFIIISGFMPAKSVLFDNKLNAIFEFGTHYRNLVKWNPFSRFVVLAGFGNLNGEMEVWDVKTQQCIGKGKSDCAIKLEWFDDGRHFLTAVLNPRLRVNNNVKIFNYKCKLLFKQDFSFTELYDVRWSPFLSRKFEDRDPSPPSKEESAKEEKPRILFNPKGRSSLCVHLDFMTALKAENKTVSTGKKFTSNTEYLQNINVQQPGPSPVSEKPKPTYPPGYVPPPEKKKKKKKALV